MSLQDVQYLISKYNLKPDTDRSQHFLHSDEILDQIVAAGDIQPTEVVVEVGPGIGNLTSLLAQKAKSVVAIELDRRFEPLLNSLTAVNKNVTVLYDDALKIDYDTIKKNSGMSTDDVYSIIANIPYNITSRLLRHVMHLKKLPRVIVFLIQKEVAERIIAGKGNHTKLSLSVQFYGSPEIVFQVPRENFKPKPEVDSALLRITNVHEWNFPESEKLIWQLINFGFSSRRKMLANNLISGLQIPRKNVEALMHAAEIAPSCRAQDVSLPQWRSLGAAWNQVN